MGDNHIAISADGVGMEDIAYREVKKKKKSQKCRDKSKHKSKNIYLRKPVF